ncbi:MAG: hypothetical protein AB2L12_18190 [Smithellaceae bacterium]
MDKNEIWNKLCFLTPSAIRSVERYTLAKKANESLWAHIDYNLAQHIIVHDHPKWGKFVPEILGKKVRTLYWDKRAESIYTGKKEIIWIKGSGQGSATALLRCVEMAIAKGKYYGFIHLDDHIYCDPFSALLNAGFMAMEDNENLLWTRFSGYPLIYNKKSMLIKRNDKVIFDKVSLSPLRTPLYTLWQSPINNAVNYGRYWPIAMWFCIFRLEFLKTILKWAIGNKAMNLGNVEAFFKEKGGFDLVVNSFSEFFFGYINMQFGGFEMHRNTNWQQLISAENNPIL